jgi:hypothetical protein
LLRVLLLIPEFSLTWFTPLPNFVEVLHFVYLAEQRICHPGVLINALYFLGLRGLAILFLHYFGAVDNISRHYGASGWLL